MVLIAEAGQEEERGERRRLAYHRHCVMCVYVNVVATELMSDCVHCTSRKIPSQISK